MSAIKFAIEVECWMDTLFFHSYQFVGHVLRPSYTYRCSKYDRI